MKILFRSTGLLMLLGLLMACGGAPPEQAAPAADQEVAEEVPTRVIETEEEPTEAPAEEPEVVEAEDEAVEMAEEMAEDESEAVMAVDGPTHQPAVTVEEALEERPYDQIKGGDDPLLTIIEYGDFQ